MPLDELKDVRPPVDLPPDFFWLIFILVLLTILGLAFLARWLKSKYKKQKQNPTIIRPPWDIAFEEIMALENDNLPAKGEIEAYFVRLSSIIRHYLERRFAVHAPEMTTDEFLTHVETMPVLGSAQKMILKEFLTLSDMVKFARYQSTDHEMTQALNAAKHLIKDTIPQVVTPPDGASQPV